MLFSICVDNHIIFLFLSVNTVNVLMNFLILTLLCITGKKTSPSVSVSLYLEFLLIMFIRVLGGRLWGCTESDTTEAT